jgi:hypothetical protein
MADVPKPVDTPEPAVAAAPASPEASGPAAPSETPAVLEKGNDGWIDEAKPATDRGISSLASRIGGLSTDSDEKPAAAAEAAEADEGSSSRGFFLPQPHPLPHLPLALTGSRLTLDCPSSRLPSPVTLQIS